MRFFECRGPNISICYNTCTNTENFLSYNKEHRNQPQREYYKSVVSLKCSVWSSRKSAYYELRTVCPISRTLRLIPFNPIPCERICSKMALPWLISSSTALCEDCKRSWRNNSQSSIETRVASFGRNLK